MPPNPFHDESPDAARIAEEAALWLARRDCGLSSSEQDEYLQWLAADPRHAEALRQHAAAFERMMQLYEWQPGGSAAANPELFAPTSASRVRRWVWTLGAAAAVLLGGALLLDRPGDPGAGAVRSYVRVNERQALPDGSVVELKDGSRILVEFTAGERRVRLAGEAHFQVAKNPTPFVVVAGGVAVRAVGTAFNTRIDTDAVEVVVTEGRVAVAKLNPENGNPPPVTPPTASPVADWAEVGAGQRGIVSLTAEAAPRISDLTPVQTKHLLEWKAPRLQFAETPLAVAVKEFNRRNAVRLVVADRDLGTVPIGGTFRADNPEGFARVLELTLELKATRRGDHEIVLSR